MNRRQILAVAVIAVAALTLPALANAQATRTWVSGVGDDANPCSRTAPCKTFAGAISKTASGGIINVLDPGGFGAVTITKPITITGPRGYGHLLSSGVQGIIINITSAPLGPVILRNLDISGAGTTLGTNGINFIAGRTLRLDNVAIESYSNIGLLVQATTPRIYANNLMMTQVNRGIVLNGGSSVGSSFVHLDITEGTNGIETFGAGNALNVTDCSITDESGVGMVSTGSNVHLEGCEFHNNGIGIKADGGTTRVSNSEITNNTTGVSAVNGGSVLSRGNNTLEDNAGGNSFSGTYGPK
jgi:hypothetical protein